MVATRNFSIVSKYSSLSKLLRIAAYCLQLKNNAKTNSKKIVGSLYYDEIEKATIVIVKLVLSNIWHNELNCLKKLLQ